MDKDMEAKSLIESLFVSKALYHNLFENANEAILFTSDHRIIDCNKAALALFGFRSKPDMINRPIFDFTPEKQNDGQYSSEKAWKLIAGNSPKKPLNFNWKYQKYNGIVFDAEVSFHPFEHENQDYQQVVLRESGPKKTVEEKLKNTKNLVENIIDAIPQPLFIKDSQFVYTNCNQAFADYIGKSREEIIGSTVFQISDEEKANIYHKADLELLESGTSQIYESKVKSQEETRDVIFRKSIISDHDGNKLGIIGFIDDITEYKKTREKLIATEIKYKKIFENVQDVFYCTDLNGILTEISPSIQKHAKYAPTDVIGKPIESFYVNPSDREKMIGEIREKGEALDFEVLLKGREGQHLWASVNAHFSHDENGVINGVEGTFRNLTERKQAEEKLKQSLSLLQATLDSTTNGILVVNRAGKIASYNKQFKEMFRLPAEVLESKDDSAAIKLVLDQLKDPDQFVSKVQYLYNNPEIESFDIIELKDGRIFERFSGPQQLDGKPIGRVWNFRDVTVRKRAEEQMLLMAHTLKSINESISITDTSNKILFINAAFLKTYGYSDEDELIGKNISIVRSQANNPEVVGKIAESTIKSGWQGELLNKRKDGTEFPISLSTSIVQNENGETLGLVGVAVDITDRKLAEKALQAKEAHLNTLVHTIPDLIWEKDADGVYLTCNKTFENFFGATAKEIIGKTDYHFVEKELADFFRDNDQKAIIAGKPTINEEWVTFANDGHRALLETIKTPMFDANGGVIGVLGIGRDITSRKNAEEQLRQSETKYRTLIESMPDGVYRSTPEGKFVEINQAMVEILGYSGKEELMAIDIKTQLYFAPEEREELIIRLDPTKLDVYVLKKKDGTAVWVEDHGWFIRDENGNVIFHEGVTRDVTERKEAELQLQKYSEELKELNATKDKFFSIIAHDLKNPFNSISGLSEIIKNEAKHLDIATIEQYAEIINTTSKNTFRLLENLLDWARVQQSKMPFQPGSLLLKTSANEVINLMIEKANSKMIAIINYIPDDLIITADKNMLETILRNLISNALKFTSVNGKIEINALSRGPEIEVSVKDTGTGITSEDIDKIFRIGSSFTKRGTENEKGTGLGLLLCKEFVEKHKGQIKVESKVGVGSTFTFTINQTDIITK